VDVVLREQPVVPFSFTVDRLKPPSKKPQLMPAVLSRSPMLTPSICALLLAEAQVSPVGSTSLIRV
jgi:hypothetical protein